MSSQYRNQYPASGRVHQSPHHGRRGQGAAAQSAEAQRADRERQMREVERRRREEIDADRRRATRPMDKMMPDGVAALIVGDGAEQYRKLREVERKLDATIMRKRLDVQDQIASGGPNGGVGFGNPTMRMKRMKVWISNTVENQPWQGSGMEESAFDFNMESEASYKVKIESMLLDDEEDEITEDESDDEAEEAPQKSIEDAMDTDGQTKTQSAPTPPRKKTKLSHFFKSITIDFDRNKDLQPDSMTQIEWKRPQVAPNIAVLPPSADFDTLEFERKSDENINCIINFYRDEQPERFLLDKALSDILDTTEDDRTSIMMGIWEYIKANGLQQDDERRQIHCDEKLKAVCDNRDVVYFPHIPTMIIPHLSPLPPLSIPYTIRCDPEYHALPTSQRYTICTLLVPCPPTPPAQLPASSLTTLREISHHDQHLANIIQGISNSERKHNFFTQLSRDPVNFTKRWMASQRHDLAVVSGEDGRLGDGSILSGEWAHGGKNSVWAKNDVRDAVSVMVQRPDKTGRAF